MFSKITHSRFAGIALAGAITAGVLGAGGVAMAEGGPGSPTVMTSSVSMTAQGNHPRAKVLLALRDDIIAKSHLTKDQFKAGIKAHESINEILGANGANAAAVETQVSTDAQAKIAAAVSDGTITPEQATKLNSKLPALLDKVFTHVPDGSIRDLLKDTRKDAIKTAADVIGIPVKTLVTDLHSGQSIATVANTKTPDVISALDSKADAAIDTAVTNGKVKAERAPELKLKAHAHIETFVNKTR